MQRSVQICIAVPEGLTVMLLVTSEGMVSQRTIKGRVFATVVAYILGFNPKSLRRYSFHISSLFVIHTTHLTIR